MKWNRSACLCYFWRQQGFMSPVEWLAMSVFLVSCTMISSTCEAMRREGTGLGLSIKLAGSNIPPSCKPCSHAAVVG